SEKFLFWSKDLITEPAFSSFLFLFCLSRAQVYYVTAIENTLLYCIPRATLKQAMTENEAVRHHFACEEGERLAFRYQDNALSANNVLYLKPISTIQNTVMVVVTPDASIRSVAEKMVTQHRSSALVMSQGKLLGIVTDRDLTKRVVAQGVDIQNPISLVMTKNPVTVSANEPIISAIELMMQHNIRSLPVMENQRVTGVLTATSLVQKNSIQAVYLISRIYRQESVSELKALVFQRQTVFESLVDANVPALTIQLMMSMIADAFTKRLLQLAEKQLGAPPCGYCWFVAGSQARQEMHYLSDQDSGVILERDVNEQEINWFRQLSDFVCYGLEDCGYALCPGHMMPTNPKWCQPLARWKENYRQWLRHPESESLLHFSVFLDIRFLYGQASLFESLVSEVKQNLQERRRLLSILVANSLRVSPPLGIFRQFVLVKNGENHSVFNIKKQAINLLIELARVYALDAGELLSSTAERLKVAENAGIISSASHKELLEAYTFINQVRFNYQRQSLNHGQVFSNQIEPELLTQFERNHLKDAFRIISRTQEAALQRFHAKGVLQ
ncbi:DUF294 nucleotidyltransferase-like domain-containing protein, partial [Xenorhabdus mauleonii]